MNYYDIINDLRTIYQVAYPNMLPFSNAKRDSREFVYATLLFSAVNALNIDHVEDIDMISLYLYLMDKANVSLSDIYTCLGKDKMITETDIDPFLYEEYSDDRLFDDINQIRDTRPDLFFELVGLEQYNKNKFNFIDFFFYNMDEYILTHIPKKNEKFNYAKIKETKKYLDDLFNVSVYNITADSDRQAYSEYVLDYIKAHKIKLKDFKASINKMLTEYDYKVDKVKEVINQNLPKQATKLITKKMELKAKTDMQERIDIYSRLRTLPSQIVGQKEATERVVDALLGALVGFRSDDEPMASFLLTGPTGVGKTETAKAVANLCCNGHMFTVDMSSYKNKEDVSRLVGASPNFAGYGDKNLFCEFLKNHPNGVILFDELDKAHFDCFDVFMHALDEGVFIDSVGRTYSLKDNILFFTTNLTNYIPQKVGFGTLQKSRTEETLTSQSAGLRKEFIARIPNVIEYKALSIESCKLIAKNFINEQIKNYQYKNPESKLKFSYTEELIEKIVNSANTKLLGARDLKQFVKKFFVKPITNYIVTNNPNDGEIIVDVDDIIYKQKRQRTYNNIKVETKNASIN